MSTAYGEVAARGDFIDGAWRPVTKPDGEIVKRSPADLDDVLGSFAWSAAAMDHAVASARQAQRGWEATPLNERLSQLQRFKAELAARQERLAVSIARELGKPLWEARTEVAALLAKVDITIDEGLPLVEGFMRDGGALECRFRAHGVLAILGPFNFPLHLPHGHAVPALALGNTVVLKPSEVAPATAQLYAEAIEAAEFPPGVFNVVQGAGVSGAKLAAHDDVDGVLFTGSVDVGVAIQRANLHRPGRLLALELGGKNAALVLGDAPFEKAVRDVLFSGFVTAGQRCTAVSRVIVERTLGDRFCEALVKGARSLVVGKWDDPAVFMGPLATEAALDKFLGGQAMAAEEGSETLLATTIPATGARGYYTTPAIHRIHTQRASSAYQRQELFGPDLAVYYADDTEHAVALANDTRYGLAAAVFTRHERTFEQCARTLRAGCVTWNMPTVGASGRLPFGGVGDSGNHRPAALFSSRYCVWPQAVQRGPAEVDPARDPPGFRWAGA